MVLAVTTLQAATKVYAPMPELINVHPDYQYATARVLKSYVDGEGTYQLVIPERSTDSGMVPMPSQDSVASIAKAKGCSE